MPLKWFICPDGEKIEVDKCLGFYGCRYDNDRCKSLRFLAKAGFDRDWRGVTASMAGNGIRQIYLKRVTDYAVNPESRTWAIIGTDSHAGLHKDAPANVLSEERLSRGTPDCLEAEAQLLLGGKPEAYVLYDDKFWGSYKVAKALEGDTLAERLQLNSYRIAFEEARFPISKLFLEVTVRDGGTWIAKKRGIDKTTYRISVAILPDDAVIAFYRNINDRLEFAMQTGIVPKLCNDWEAWGDGKKKKWKRMRCANYCEVLEECKKRGEG